jgi:hypothetical protein
MLWGIVIQPLTFYWAYQQFRLVGHVELSTLSSITWCVSAIVIKCLLITLSRYSSTQGRTCAQINLDSIVMYLLGKTAFHVPNNGFDDSCWITSMPGLQDSFTVLPFPIIMQRRTMKFIIVGITIQAMSILTWIWIEPCFILIYSLFATIFGILLVRMHSHSCNFVLYSWGEYTLLRQLLYGMMYYYTWSGLVWYKCVEFRSILHTHSIPF